MPGQSLSLAGAGATAPSTPPPVGHRRKSALYQAGIGLGKHLVLLPLTLLFLFPWFWMITTSLKTPDQILRFPPQWIPNPVTFEAYPDAVFDASMLKYGANTLFLCVVNVIGAILSNTVVAYSFARIHWPGRDAMFIGVLATMMLPYQVVMIPLYIIFAKLNWVNTYLPLLVPTFFAAPFFVFLLRQFMRTIPEDLSDAARIDGANELRALWDVFIPLIRPALAVVALFEFIGNWNAFLQPLIYLSDQSKYTIALGLMNLRMHYGLSNYAVIMAAAFLSLLPIAVLFFLAQRTFIEGIALTGLKG